MIRMLMTTQLNFLNRGWMMRDTKMHLEVLITWDGMVQWLQLIKLRMRWR